MGSPFGDAADGLLGAGVGTGEAGTLGVLLAAGEGVLPLLALGLLAASSREEPARACPPARTAGPDAPAAFAEELALVVGDGLVLEPVVRYVVVHPGDGLL